jgi:hypothetical protein
MSSVSLAPPAAVRVDDPTRAVADPELPTLAAALDPGVVERELAPLLADLRALRVAGVRVVRHKPGRRCLVEYDIEATGRDGTPHAFTLIGKVRRRRSGSTPYVLTRALWDAGFEASSADGISVPEPVGLSAPLRMWFQRKVPGTPMTHLLAGPDAPALAERVAAAALKVHRTGIPPKRAHTMADELRILHEVLPTVAASRARLAPRVNAMLRACDALGARVPAPLSCGIHRDFYGDQVLVDGDRLWLIDFDLYCLGDPALDIGNFVGHITEQALREHGAPDALAAAEVALEDAFAALAGVHVRPAVQAYTTLTLARHVYLSTVLSGRALVTEQLLDLCEQRLDLPVRRSR